MKDIRRCFILPLSFFDEEATAFAGALATAAALTIPPLLLCVRIKEEVTFFGGDGLDSTEAGSTRCHQWEKLQDGESRFLPSESRRFGGAGKEVLRCWDRAIACEHCAIRGKVGVSLLTLSAVTVSPFPGLSIPWVWYIQ